ncbi:MAG: hypothetical protein TE42_10610 [Candidatus Synechococcus spongiarum SP3]|uniref:Uncharacterized protein n=1 Tax=Candidatus Synechococcus spongiarum SP3 TaxID=1604020 RepID=A0A0G2IVD1_9SYNE|nr:MAG: hypothetical protein TE42_10610 [Candidatus Synechococcus spongiarum SP3]
MGMGLLSFRRWPLSLFREPFFLQDATPEDGEESKAREWGAEGRESWFSCRLTVVDTSQALFSPDWTEGKRLQLGLYSLPSEESSTTSQPPV